MWWFMPTTFHCNKHPSSNLCKRPSGIRIIIIILSKLNYVVFLFQHQLEPVFFSFQDIVWDTQLYSPRSTRQERPQLWSRFVVFRLYSVSISFLCPTLTCFRSPALVNTCDVSPVLLECWLSDLNEIGNKLSLGIRSCHMAISSIPGSPVWARNCRNWPLRLRI